MSDPTSSVDSSTPRKAIKALSGDSPVLLRAGVVVALAVVAFGAGVWATTMAGAITQLTANAVKTDLKLEKLEGLMLDVLRGQESRQENRKGTL